MRAQVAVETEPEADELLLRLARELNPQESITLARLVAQRAGEAQLARVLHAVLLLDLTGNLADLDGVCETVLKVYSKVFEEGQVH